jgi:hypothetical protein
MCLISTFKNQVPFLKHINICKSVRYLMKFSGTLAVFSENKKKTSKNEKSNMLSALKAIGKQFPLHNRKLKYSPQFYNHYKAAL